MESLSQEFGDQFAGFDEELGGLAMKVNGEGIGHVDCREDHESGTVEKQFDEGFWEDLIMSDEEDEYEHELDDEEVGNVFGDQLGFL